MPLVRLVSWNLAAAETHGASLAAAGFAVEASPFSPSGMVGQLRDLAPAAVVIDLDHRPSHGLAVAIAIRTSVSTRNIPIIFAGGAPEKLVRVRAELPDATFTTWDGVAAAVRRTLRNRPVAPVRPAGIMERYAGASLARKLGLKPDTEVALLAPPDAFPDLLAELAPETRFVSRIGRGTSLALWFIRSRQELEGEMAYLAARLPEACGLWIVYPKKTGRHPVDFNLKDVRAAANASDLVDFKICAVDADWTGLRFARRRGKAV